MKKILAIGIMFCFILLNVSVAQKEMAKKTISFGVEKKSSANLRAIESRGKEN